MTADRRTRLKRTAPRWGALAVIAVGLVTVLLALSLWGRVWLAGLFIVVVGFLLMVAGLNPRRPDSPSGWPRSPAAKPIDATL